jgi:hypothetical protein
VTPARKAVIWVLAIAVLLFVPFEAYRIVKQWPQDLPWTRLDLRWPVGAFTGRKLAGLTQDFPRCQALLDEAGVRYAKLPPVVAGEGGACSYADGIRFTDGGPRAVDFAPRDVTTSCAVAAALAVWEREVLQPAAHKHFGSRVTAIDHLGSYSCRKMVGKYHSSWSQHATGNAIDISGFRLADGTRIVVRGDWRGEGAKAAFLRDVRKGACRLFTIVLSPDYNAAHEDHLHLDEMPGGEFGWRGCH